MPKIHDNNYKPLRPRYGPIVSERPSPFDFIFYRLCPRVPSCHRLPRYRRKLSARGWPHVFPIHRAVPNAYAEASGAIRVLFSRLLVTLRGLRQAPDTLPHHRLPAAEASVSGTRAQSYITYQPPQGAQRCIDKRRTRKIQLDAKNT